MEKSGLSLTPHAKRFLVRLYLSLGTAEGVGALLYLLILTPDPKTRTVLGYSAERLLLIAGILVALITIAALTAKSFRDERWASKAAGLLLDRPESIPFLLIVLGLGAILISGWIALFRSDLLLSLNPAILTRLAPYFVWPLLFAAQLVLAWYWAWGRDRYSMPRLDWDIAALIVLFSIAFSARAGMSGYGLPYQTVWDEVVTYPQAMDMLAQPGLKPDSNVPGYGKAAYGDLLVYVTAAGEVLGLVNGFRTQQVESLAAYLSPPSGVSSLFGAVHASGIPLRYPRVILAFINSFAPIAIYLGLRKYLKADRWSAFGGALIFAIFSRDVLYYSAYILPDALATTLFCFLLLAAWKIIDDQNVNTGPLGIASFLTGVIASVTIRLASVVSLPFLALALARNRDRGIQRIATIAVGLPAGFILTSPYALLDLPGYLTKITSFSWYHELTWSHRLSNFLFYFQGMFKPGFNSTYIDSQTGSVGFGLLVGLLAVIGAGRLIVRFPRHTALMLAFAALHFYSILPVVQRFTRHSLVLYPLICIFAGNGLVLLRDALQIGITRLTSAEQKGKFQQAVQTHSAFLNSAAPALILILFSVASAGQIRLSVRYLRRIREFKTPQVKVAEYLSGVLQAQDRVGILDIVPWVEADLRARDIPFERIGIAETLDGLRAQGITHIVGTDRIKDDYGSAAGTIWENFKTPEHRLTDFGSLSLQYAGYPAGQLYLYIAAVPEE